MSGRVMARYCRAPMRLRKWVISAKGVSAPFVDEETAIGSSSVLHFEKLILRNRTTTSDELEARDRARHARILRNSTTAGAVEFYLSGSFDPKLVGYIHIYVLQSISNYLFNYVFHEVNI
uniref:Uncharacterized protein n=1 Tax=Solanum lycopersicum TaxID=4081 RepID=A0A3Q7ETY0_SOLLC